MCCQYKLMFCSKQQVFILIQRLSGTGSLLNMSKLTGGQFEKHNNTNKKFFFVVVVFDTLNTQTAHVTIN